MDQNSSPRKAARKTVAFLIPTHWASVMGGAQYQAKLLIERMAERGGFDVHYLARRMPDDYQSDDHRLHRCGTSTGINLLLDTPTILRKLEELQPDTVYHQVACAYTGVAAWYCKRNNAKFVWHIASDIDVEPWTRTQRPNPVVSFVDKKILEYGLRHADAIVAQTQLQTELLQRHYQRDATTVIKNFHPAVTQTICKNGKTRVLWIANLKQLKQPEIFVEAARRLQALDAEFVLIGGMQMPPAKAAEITAAMNETPNVHYAGELTQDEVNEQLAISHLLVNTSEYEGFSNTFVQAWQREVPVCSLNVNPDQLLSDTPLGRCANGSVDLLTKQIEDIVTNPEQRHQMGKDCRHYAEKEHSQDNADRLIDLF